MIDAIRALSPIARAELDACSIEWVQHRFRLLGYLVRCPRIPSAVVLAVADLGCSLAVTLYPMRNPDGTPKE